MNFVTRPLISSPAERRGGGEHETIDRPGQKLAMILNRNWPLIQVSAKFFSVNENASKNLNDLTTYINGIKRDLEEGNTWPAYASIACFGVGLVVLVKYLRCKPD